MREAGSSPSGVKDLGIILSFPVWSGAKPQLARVFMLFCSQAVSSSCCEKLHVHFGIVSFHSFFCFIV